MWPSQKTQTLMGDDNHLGSVCFDFRETNVEHLSMWYMVLVPNDHRRKPVTEPEPSPINYSA